MARFAPRLCSRRVRTPSGVSAAADGSLIPQEIRRDRGDTLAPGGGFGTPGSVPGMRASLETDGLAVLHADYCDTSHRGAVGFVSFKLIDRNRVRLVTSDRVELECYGPSCGRLLSLCLLSVVTDVFGPNRHSIDCQYLVDLG